MKIVFLNVWWGELQEKVDAFVKEQKPSTDVFCFQEASPNSQEIFSGLLNDFEKSNCDKWVKEEETYALANFVSNKSSNQNSTPIMEDSFGLGLGFETKFERDGKTFNICNFHGIPMPPEKFDCPERLEQSKTLIKSFENLDGIKIIGGDFNLELETESVEMFEKNGYRNLIKEFKIPTTRNNLAWSKYPTRKFFSDYVFASPNVKIKNFSVPDLEISDHLPMILEFEA